MQISVSLNDDIPSPYHNRFKVIGEDHPDPITLLITEYVWAPIVWRDGVRKSTNFESSDFLVLDFDNGLWSLDDAQAWCASQGYSHIIGTTKSHRKIKGDQPAHDRFRVIIPWETRITSSGAYQQNMQRIAKLIPCDTQALDAARCYKPCVEITACGPGRPMPWILYQEQARREPTVYEKSGVLPSWLRAMLVEVPEAGTRNRHAFKLACKLAEHGYGEQQVIEMICDAPINLPTADKISAARSGFKAKRH